MSEDLYEKFLDNFWDAIDRAAQHDRPSRLTIGVGVEADVTIDIYKSRSSIKAIESMVLKAAKESRGLSVISGENEEAKP